MAGDRQGLSCLNVFGRLYVLALGACAMVSSVFAMYSCQFFSYRTLDGEPWEALTPPFDELSQASVGLFKYSELTTQKDDFLFGDKCTDYENWTEIGHNQLFYIAQWCSMFAPLAGFLAWFQILYEMIFCRLRGGFLITAFLYFAASSLQACSFMIFADTNFCFEAESQNQCTLRTGAWYSLGSSVAYLILAVLATSIPSYPGRISRLGCCVITRGAYARPDYDFGDEDRSGKIEADTSEDDEEKGYDNRLDEDGGDWSYEETSTVNWGATELAEEEGKSLRSGSTTIISDVCLNDTDGGEQETTRVMAESSSMDEVPEGKAVTFLEDDVASEKPIEIEESQEVLLEKEIPLPKKADFLDSMCCGDPLQLDKFMAPHSKAARNSKTRLSRNRNTSVDQAAGF